MATPPANVYVMAVPDAEFVEICRRLLERNHTDHITLISKDKEHIKFYRRGDKVKAIRIIDGKPMKFLVEPLSKVMPQPNTQNERDWLKKQIHEQNPTYNNARLEYEVDMVYEMRKSVEEIVKATGCKPEQAMKSLEIAMASKEAEQKMGNAKEKMEKVEECIEDEEKS
jgi:hypothetical protein